MISYTPRDVEATLKAQNIASFLEDKELDALAQRLLRQVEMDEESRSEWLEEAKRWIKLATLITEAKSYPWPNAANVKFPLIAVTSLQFHARAQQTLLKSPETLVKVKKVPQGHDENISQRANRVSRFMSYQLYEDIPHWMDESDRLLLLLPICGTVFRKVFFDPDTASITSDVVLPTRLIVNYYAEDLDSAMVTHVFYLSKNDVYTRKATGSYLDVDFGQPKYKGEFHEVPELTKQTPPADSDYMPYKMYDVYTTLDLDGDGYEEPYIVTINCDSEKVVRITPRFGASHVERNGDQIIRITPYKSFVRYFFLPSIESNIYGLGFGHLLGPTNEAVNTIINQLLDTGHLSALPSGFIGKGARLPGGQVRLRPGEWSAVQSLGDDIRKNIFPLPTSEPSPVLFQLLGLLVENGQQLGSVADIMKGETPGQNTPHSTTRSALEQGMMVFVSIYKRIWRSMKEELKIMYRLNQWYLPDQSYSNILNEEAQVQADFEIEKLDIIPSADPEATSEMQGLLKAESLLQKTAALNLNRAEVTKRVLEAEGHINIPALMESPPPPTPPEIQIKQQELELKKQQLKLEARNSQFEALKDLAQAIAQLASIESAEAKNQIAMLTAEYQKQASQGDQILKAVELYDKNDQADKQREVDEKSNQQKSGPSANSS